MALINCPECNNEVSEKAVMCPSCGYPLEPENSHLNKTNKSTETLKNICNRCNFEFELGLQYCPNCQSDMYERNVIDNNTNNISSNSSLLIKIIGAIGSIMLILGVYMPIVSAGGSLIGGSINFIDYAKLFDINLGNFVIAIAVISLLCSLLGAFKLLWITGISSLFAIGMPYYQLQSKINAIKENPISSLGDIVVQSSKLEWGWGILLIGVIVIICSAALGSNK